MESNSSYSPFVEHSFRRLTLLIHQQDLLDTTNKKPAEQSFDTSSSSSNIKSHQELNHNKSLDTKIRVEPMSRTYRTYMRPPKNRTTISHRCCFSSSQFCDRSETSFNHSFEPSCSSLLTKQESNKLSIHMSSEQTLYDIRFERDRQNDVRRKYNIPSPFQRKWLRQPRYVPQERPHIVHIEQSQTR